MSKHYWLFVTLCGADLFVVLHRKCGKPTCHCVQGG